MLQELRKSNVSLCLAQWNSISFTDVGPEFASVKEDGARSAQVQQGGQLRDFVLYVHL